jgi:2'-5' RNA ligase
MTIAEENPKSPHVRAFIAVPVDPLVIGQITEVQRTLREKTSPDFARWVRPEQLHLTLRFFGNVPLDQLPAIEAATRMACVSLPEFKLAAQAVGCFPNFRAPRVVWVGITGEIGRLDEFRQAIANHTRSFGEPPEERPFQPHLTIGRIKQQNPQGKELLAKRASESAQKNFGEWRVSHVQLMRSVLSPQGSTYSILATIPLGLESG